MADSLTGVRAILGKSPAATRLMSSLLENQWEGETEKDADSGPNNRERRGEERRE